jgi:primosomal protein N' (replication factor Y) (superfamily II helicase)
VSDLGKAFPGVPVIRADGEKPILRVGSDPALVVATRGAEPIASGGYAACLLLDGAAMLQRESLGSVEHTLRGWEHAISLVSSQGKVFVTEVEGQPALAVASGSYHSLLSHELSQRESLRLPPAIRFVAISGPPSAVDAIAQAALAVSGDIDVLGPVRLDDGLVRQVMRFSYALGPAVQGAVRSAYLKGLSGPRGQARDRVRIVFDNPHSLDALTADEG